MRDVQIEKRSAQEDALQRRLMRLLDKLRESEAMIRDCLDEREGEHGSPKRAVG